MRLYTLDVHTIGLKLGAKSSGPLLQEGLAARVRRQKRGGEEATERGHRKNKTALALDHARSDELGNAQSSHAVDDNDVIHLLLGCLVERHRNVVAQADVVDQDGDVKSIDKFRQFRVIGIFVLRKVHGQSLHGGLGTILGGDVGGEGIELGLGAGDEDQVVALGRERESKLLANAIRGTSDECPGTTRTEFSELYQFMSSCRLST